MPDVISTEETTEGHKGALSPRYERRQKEDRHKEEEKVWVRGDNGPVRKQERKEEQGKSENSQEKNRGTNLT